MTTPKTLKHRGYAIVIGLLATACRQENQFLDPLPFVFVNEQVFVNELRAQPLTLPGGFIYINGGLKGIIVYRRGQGDFVAVERQSPVVPGCQVKADASRLFLRDTCSNSQFTFEGQVSSGPASANLRQYRVNYDGTRILITNN